MVREAYTQEIQEVLKLTLLDTLVTPVGTPSSGSASDNTCIWTCASTYLWYIGRPPSYPETNHRSTDRPPECYSATENNTQEDTL
jgi:hypothetical protein